MSGVVLIGTWSPPLLAFTRNCHRQSLPVYLLEVGARKSHWRCFSSCLAGGECIRRQAIGTPEGIRLIRDYVSAVGAQAIVTMDDKRLLWLARNRSVFEPDCKLLMPSADALQFVSSKRNQIELASKVGFDVLPTTYVSEPSDCRSVSVGRYPVVVRPDRKSGPTSPFKVKLVSCPAELEALAHASDGAHGPLIAQPFVSLPNMIVHGARSETGTVLTMQAFLVPRKFEGVTLTIMPTEFPPGLEQSCRDFAEAAGVTGCFHFELLFSPAAKRAWFLEINARLGGTTDKVTRLGFDETSYLLRAYGIRTVFAAGPPLRPGLAANKRALLKHLLWTLRGDLTALDYPPGTRMRHAARSLRDLWAASDSVFDWRDLRGTFWWSRQRSERP